MTQKNKVPAPPAPDTREARAIKGSAQDAIGKLIGDDAASARGEAKRRAAGQTSEPQGGGRDPSSRE